MVKFLGDAINVGVLGVEGAAVPGEHVMMLLVVSLRMLATAVAGKLGIGRGHSFYEHGHRIARHNLSGIVRGAAAVEPQE